MNESELLDKLSNLHIESSTALEIADKYFMFKYFEGIACMMVILPIFWLGTYAVYKFIKHVEEEG